jgi:hypothetical protein
MIDEAMIRHDYEMRQPSLSERGRRMSAAMQVRLGYGGLAAVARATALAPSTIGRALKELASGAVADGRVRRPGGGRKKLVDQDSSLMSDLERLVEPVTLGDPERPLRWVSKSLAKLAEAPAGHGAPSFLARIVTCFRLPLAKVRSRHRAAGPGRPISALQLSDKADNVGPTQS